MKKQLKIGALTFKYKKDAIAYFKDILNSYEIGETLNTDDCTDLCHLLEVHPNAAEIIGLGVKKIEVIESRYKSKCFQVIRGDSSREIFSYRRCIGGNSSLTTKFSKTCRDIISKDLTGVKRAYFKGRSKKGMVKCQETGEPSKWGDLAVDHRQPNTFSVIVDRFIEIQQIDIKSVKYRELFDGVYEFEDNEIAEKFKKYHKDKANLRLVKKGKNLGRSYQARVKRQKKDLIIK
ncbi:DCL family protein [Desulfobacterota bacterium M19]